MSIKDKLKEGAAYVREEADEALHDDAGASKARADRNAARTAQGKSELLTKPGSKNN